MMKLEIKAFRTKVISNETEYSILLHVNNKTSKTKISKMGEDDTISYIIAETSDVIWIKK